MSVWTNLIWLLLLGGFFSGKLQGKKKPSACSVPNDMLAITDNIQGFTMFMFCRVGE